MHYQILDAVEPRSTSKLEPTASDTKKFAIRAHQHMWPCVCRSPRHLDVMSILHGRDSTFSGCSTEHISFAHIEHQRVCTQRKRAVLQVCRRLVRANQAHRPFHVASLLLGTHRHHRLAERDRIALLSTPCRRKTSSDHAVNDDI